MRINKPIWDGIGKFAAIAALVLWLPTGCSRPAADSATSDLAAGDQGASEGAAADESGASADAETLQAVSDDPVVTEDPRERVEAESAGEQPQRSDAPQIAEVPRVPVDRPAEPAVEIVEPDDDWSPAAVETEPQQPAVIETFDTRIVTLPAGTELAVEFDSAVSSESSEVGDEVLARLAESQLVDGTVAIPSGSLLIGEVVDVRSTRRFGGRATLVLAFHTLRLETGDDVEVDLAWSAEDRGQKKKDAAKIGGGAAAGAVAGSVLKDSDGAKVGAVIGAAVGAVSAARDRGDAIEIAEGSLSTLVLDLGLEVPVRVRRLEAR